MNNPEGSITEILSTDYLAYARYVVEGRAIPSFSDGLKPVQRKILAAAMANCKDKYTQVAALTGATMHQFGYHHGDTSCNGAIVVMNQPFMQGMPYLDKSGQYGWLYDRTAGQPRYIKTKLSGWSQLLLHDEPELTYNYEDGQKQEPVNYLPILPMLLINGTNGIAVGYATSFVNRNPLEVALATREYLLTNNLPDYKLTPFVNGHCGEWSYWNGQYEHVSPYHRKNSTVLSIKGLPINTTTAKFEAYLNSLIEANLIVKWQNLSTRAKIHYDIHMKQSALDALIQENGVPGFFRLIHRLHKDNLTCIMPDKSIKRFESPIQFIRDFADYRLKYYVKRKLRMLADIKARIAYLDDLIRFIDLVNNGTITFRGKTKRQLEAELTELNINKVVLNIQVYNLTDDNKQKHIVELQRLHTALRKIEQTTERQMFIADIDNLLIHLRKYYTIEPVLNMKQEYLPRIKDIT